MNRFAALLDRLILAPQRNAKLRLLTEYFRTTPDPDRGYALAALTGELSIASIKPAILRTLITQRMDPILFRYSYDYVGDLAETIALAWPSLTTGPLVPDRFLETVIDGALDLGVANRAAPRPEMNTNDDRNLSLSEIVEQLQRASRLDGPRLMERWLDALDTAGRWALVKLVTGGFRVGVSARLAKQALADFGDRPINEIEELWHGIELPYLRLFAWLEGRGPQPHSTAAAPFRPVMLAHAIGDKELSGIRPEDYAAEWKWDGIRVQAVANGRQRRLYSRTGDDISKAFPDIIDALDFDGAIDGEVLIGRMSGGGMEPATFGDLQRRLNRKTVSAKLLESHPAFLRAYDCLIDGAEDLRTLPFRDRRGRLEALLKGSDPSRLELSPLVPFGSVAELTDLRDSPPTPGSEGVMLKRWDSPYLPGRAKGPWSKWKRDPHIVDAVLMYAQRGHGRRSSFYSDYTFGVWKAGEAGDELVPVGKAYFGFSDEELVEIDRFVRNNTVGRFGPVREVVHDADAGLVLEVAFEGLNRSTRHKSGVAMRFPRISRLRWDKPPGEADRLEALESLIG